jgi:predicted HicB family RNase H-like nuclease
LENEALQNFDATAVSWITVCLEEGYSIALPAEASVYSGKIALRIPAGLHEDMAGLAAVDDCSVNQLLAVAISEYLAAARVCLRRNA